MKVLVPGHVYTVQGYDGAGPQHRDFMKRVGPGYPGNEGLPHGGTNCQEELRVLIDRVKYLDAQEKCPQNKAVLNHLRTALHLFEFRAAERKGKLREYHMMPGFRPDLVGIELLTPCETCGHIFPHEHVK